MSKFQARDLGEAKLFVGLLITRDREAKTIKLSQQRMVSELVAKYGLKDAKHKATPIHISVKLGKEDSPPLDKEKFRYSELVGSLMYLSVCTRPDITQAVGALARYMANPTENHWEAGKGVLRYLAGTEKIGIKFGPEKFGVIGYADADYAGDIDTRRSTTGYVFLLNGGAISWSSRLQPTVAASTTEAEYMAAAFAVKEALWLRKLMKDLGQEVPTMKIYGDNQSALKLLKNPIASSRSKHIDVIYHFARERVERNEVCFSYINTEEMVADILTKSLPENKFEKCRDRMGLRTNRVGNAKLPKLED
jgi:hypothetical protein